MPILRIRTAALSPMTRPATVPLSGLLHGLTFDRRTWGPVVDRP